MKTLFKDRLWKVAIGISVGLAFGASVVGEDVKDASVLPRDQASLVLQGLTRPSKQVELALRVSGVIAECPIEEGQHVKAGQLIAVLDSGPEEAALQISQLRANDRSELRAAEVNEGKKGEELIRQRQLAAQDSSSVWELRVVELAFDFAKAQTETARVRLEQRKRELIRDQTRLDLRTLRAPFDGVVWRIAKDVGEVVDGIYERGTIAVLLQLDPLWVELNLPVRYFGRVVVEQEATVSVQDRERVAKVISVDPIVDSGSSTFRVKLALANADGAFIAGLPASVRFQFSDDATEVASRDPKEATRVSHQIGELAVSSER